MEPGKQFPPMAIIFILALHFTGCCGYSFVVPHFDSIRGVYIAYPISWAIGAAFDGAVCVEREMDSGKRRIDVSVAIS